MSELPPHGSAAATLPRESRLDSWKEIAAYLRRDVSTVQRWEKREGMPVHRHLHDKQGSVYALRAELDAWSLGRKVPPSVEAPKRQPGEATAPPSVTVQVPTQSVAHDPVSHLLAGSAGGFLRGISAWWRRSAPALWRNPIENAEFSPVTDFEGEPHAAAISRDGKFVAFLSDRDGTTDVWITQIGAGRFYNLTAGVGLEVVNHEIRTLSFSPDDTLVLFWARTPGGSTGRRVGIWSVPTLGGQPRPYLEEVAELDWSESGRLVYHTAEPGDPMFVTRRHHPPPGAPIFSASPGSHAHFPAWSPDEAFVYFVGGIPPNELDLWRIKPSGGAPERLTFHRSRVAYPVFVNRRTLLYLATDSDASGPWLHALDVRRRVTHRIGSRVDLYTSLAISADRRRLVATRANRKADLLRSRLSELPMTFADAVRIALPTASGRSPRFGFGYLLYVASIGSTDGIWKFADGTAVELWSALRDVRILGGPAVSPNAERIAISAASATDGGQSRLYVMTADGTQARVFAESLALRGAPVWSPDGQSLLVTAADHAGAPRIHRVPLDGRPPTPLVSEYSVDPVWDPSGDFVVYSGPDIGTTFQVKAVTPDGRPYAFPDLVLTRGARRFAFLRDCRALVFLKGEMKHKNLWLLDLETGAQRPMTNFGRDIVVRDFDIYPDGRELVIEQVEQRSDVVRIDLPNR